MALYLLRLDSLKLERSGENPFYFDIVLGGRDPDGHAIRLQFDQVTDMQFGSILPNVSAQVSITDIRFWQREEARFSVTEEEHGQFSFKCIGYSDRSPPRE